jgi:hypothetical protein
MVDLAYLLHFEGEDSPGPNDDGNGGHGPG